MPRATWALLVIFAYSSLALAEVVPPRDTLSLSVEDALKLAEERSPLLRRAAKELRLAEAGRVGAGVLLPANPIATLGLGARNDRSGSLPPANGFEATGRLEQTVEIGGQRGTRLREADRNIDVARIRVDVARAETRARVRAAYVGVLISQRHLEHARAQEAIGARVFESAKARLQAGAGTDVDLNLAEVERGRLTQERVSAVLGLEESFDRLRRAIGLPEGRALGVSTPLALPDPVAETAEALLERARQRRAELRALEASTTAFDAAVVRWRRERVPSPTLFFDVMSQQPGQLYLGAGLALPIPIWRRAQGEIAVAKAARDLAAEDRAIFDEQLGIEVAQAHRVARGLRESVERWQAVSLPAAERNVELVTQGWRSGKFDLFRVVQATREAAEARQRSLVLMGALWDATINLDRVTGTGP